MVAFCLFVPSGAFPQMPFTKMTSKHAISESSHARQGHVMRKYDIEMCVGVCVCAWMLVKGLLCKEGTGMAFVSQTECHRYVKGHDARINFE